MIPVWWLHCTLQLWELSVHPALRYLYRLHPAGQYSGLQSNSEQVVGSTITERLGMQISSNGCKFERGQHADTKLSERHATACNTIQSHLPNRPHPLKSKHHS